MYRLLLLNGIKPGMMMVGMPMMMGRPVEVAHRLSCGTGYYTSYKKKRKQ